MENENSKKKIWDNVLHILKSISPAIEGWKKNVEYMCIDDTLKIKIPKTKRPPRTHLLAQMMGSRFTIQLRTVYPLLRKKSTVIFKTARKVWTKSTVGCSG